MGTVTKTIGSSGGRDFSTLALWQASLPANLVTDGNSYVGQCFNDSVFTPAGTICAISGNTTDATHFITLMCASGQSFKDNANVQTNALRYDTANGVSLSIQHYGAGVTCNVAFTVIDGLQITGFGQAIFAQGNSNIVQNCLFEYTDNGVNPVVGIGGVGATGTNTIMRNCLVITNCGSFGGGVTLGNVGLLTVANCTIVRTQDMSNFGLNMGLRTAFGGHYAGLNKVINCAIFGFATFTDDPANFGTGSTNNCTDVSATSVPNGGGSGNLVSQTYSSQFQSVATTAGADLRAKSGGSILDAGATDTTDIPAAIDIAGTSRPQGSAWDIGCWELVTGAVVTAVATAATLLMMGVG